MSHPAKEDIRLMNHSTNHNENVEPKQPTMNSSQKTNDPWYKNRQHTLTAVIAILGVVCCVIGAILLSNYMYEEGFEIPIDYTDCESNDLPVPRKCKESLNMTGKKCTCYKKLEIKEFMKAPVTVYYELDSYEQISSSYGQSRDDNQLAGHLSPTPAASCGSYSYTEGEKKPIAPCGQLADAMFNDTFYLQTNNKYILNINYGLISEEDKKQFHNPPGDLKQAFKDFAKPINWRNEVYELDTNNLDNNGFRNEAFIIWMKTDLKRKPAWRVNHTGEYESGVGPGNYTLRVTYGYPPSRYDGRRKFIISSIQKFEDLPKYRWGVALLVIGVLCIVFAALYMLRYRLRCFEFFCICLEGLFKYT